MDDPVRGIRSLGSPDAMVAGDPPLPAARSALPGPRAWRALSTSPYPEPPHPTSRARIVGSDMGTPVDHRFWDVHGLRTIDPASVSLTRHASDQARDTIGMPGGGYPAPVLPG